MKTRLSEISIITMGQSPKSSAYNYDRNGLPFLQGKTTFGRMYPYFEMWTSEWNKEADKDDLLFTVRAPVGDINIASESIAIGRGIASIKAIKCSYKYLYYLLIANKEKFILSSTGTIYDSINKNNLESVELNIHSACEQQHIVNTIGSIDDLIENYNMILLKQEQFEKLLYMYEALNGEKSPLSEYIFFVKGKKPTTLTNSGQKYLTIDVLENSSMLFADPTKTVNCNTNDILMVMDGASSGKVYIGNSGIVGSTLSKVVCNNINPYYCYIYLKNNFNNISGHNTGSAIPHTNKDLVLALNIPCQRISDSIYNNLLDYRILVNDRIYHLNKIKKIYLKKFFG